MQEGLHKVTVKFWKLFFIHLVGEEGEICFKAFQKQSSLKAFEK